MPANNIGDSIQLQTLWVKGQPQLNVERLDGGGIVVPRGAAQLRSTVKPFADGAVVDVAKHPLGRRGEGVKCESSWHKVHGRGGESSNWFTPEMKMRLQTPSPGLKNCSGNCSGCSGKCSGCSGNCSGLLRELLRPAQAAQGTAQGAAQAP